MRERPKFGHNPARERNEVWVQFCGRLMKTWAQIYKQLQAFLQQLSENTKTAIFFNSGRRYVNQAECKTVRAGRSALRNMPSWNTDYRLTSVSFHKHCR